MGRTGKRVKYYSISGTKDILGNIILGTNLVESMENNANILNKIKLLQEVLG